MSSTVLYLLIGVGATAAAIGFAQFCYWLADEARVRSIYAVERNRQRGESDLGFCRFPRFHYGPQKPAASEKQPIIFGHDIAQFGTPNVWAVECGFGECHRETCPWFDLVRQRDLFRSVTRYLCAPNGLLVFSETGKPIPTGRANPDFADMHGDIPGIYDLDTDEPIGELLQRIGAPREDRDGLIGCTDAAYNTPTCPDPNPRDIFTDCMPSVDDAEHGTDQSNTESNLDRHSATSPVDGAIVAQGGAE